MMSPSSMTSKKLPQVHNKNGNAGSKSHEGSGSNTGCALQSEVLGPKINYRGGKIFVTF